MWKRKTEEGMHLYESVQRGFQQMAAWFMWPNLTIWVMPGEANISMLQMHPDGLLIVSEKVRSPDPAIQTIFDDTHLDWKRANGYSELEVSQKRQALENVMKVDTEAMQLQRFAAAGFTTSKQWYRCLNWASFLVYKQLPTS